MNCSPISIKRNDWLTARRRVSLLTLKFEVRFTEMGSAFEKRGQQKKHKDDDVQLKFVK